MRILRAAMIQLCVWMGLMQRFGFASRSVKFEASLFSLPVYGIGRSMGRGSERGLCFATNPVFLKTANAQHLTSSVCKGRPFGHSRNAFFKVRKAHWNHGLLGVGTLRSSFENPSDSNSGLRIKERQITIENYKYRVCEVEKTSELVDLWIENQMATVDPFGVVLWPASQVLAGRIAASAVEMRGRKVVELGAGTGLCSIVAAFAGAKVVSTDTNPLSLQLLEVAAERQQLTIETMVFDINGGEELPKMHYLVAADCMYNPAVARGLARQCVRAHRDGVKVMVADSVNIARTEFQDELRRLVCPFDIEEVRLDFTGSAVGADVDVQRSVAVAIFHLAD